MNTIQEKLNQSKGSKVEIAEKQNQLLQEQIKKTEELNQRFDSLSDKLDDLRHFQPSISESSTKVINSLKNALNDAPDYSDIPKEIHHRHDWQISEKAGTWLTASLLFMLIVGVGGGLFGFYQYNQKATPERVEFEHIKNLNAQYKLDNEYFIQYVKFMKGRNPKSHSAFTKKYPPKEHVKRFMN